MGLNVILGILGFLSKGLNQNFSRRDFLKTAACTGLGAALPLSGNSTSTTTGHAAIVTATTSVPLTSSYPVIQGGAAQTYLSCVFDDPQSTVLNSEVYADLYVGDVTSQYAVRAFRRQIPLSVPNEEIAYSASEYGYRAARRLVKPGADGTVSIDTVNRTIERVISRPPAKVFRRIERRVNRNQKNQAKAKEQKAEKKKTNEPKIQTNDTGPHVFDNDYVVRGPIIGGVEMTSLGPPIEFDYRGVLR